MNKTFRILAYITTNTESVFISHQTSTNTSITPQFIFGLPGFRERVVVVVVLKSGFIFLTQLHISDDDACLLLPSL